ncbi:MAG: TetR/AcrR family transcriptional regulator [Spirochaetia bacterium]|nr:TetR/AcrR family transcriptional regulator [Spirochaetia bacterium]
MTKRDYENFSPENLAAAAAALFYKRGYGVGLNEILETAGIYKATFYKYYASKDDLAAGYIDVKKTELISLLRQLMKKYPLPAEFFSNWVKLLAKGGKSPDFYGCPFSNLFAQTLRESAPLAEKLQSAIREILSVLSEYLRTAQQTGSLKIEDNADQLAMRTFTLYEGTMTMYNLTGDAVVFARLNEYLAELCMS